MWLRFLSLIFLGFGIVYFVLGCSSTALIEPEGKVTILQLGDSWSWFTSQYGFLKEELKKDDLYKQNKVVNLNQAGLTADELNFDETWNVRLQAVINRNKDLSIIVLSIGGNDIIEKINMEDGEEKTSLKLIYIVDTIRQTINTIHLLNPNLTIIYLGLDFPNFSESRNNSILATKNNSYWEQTGRPTPSQINSILIQFTQGVIDLMDSHPYFRVSNHLGLLAAISNKTVLPGSYSNYDPVYGGGLEWEAPVQYMQISEGFIDSIHPNKEGYRLIMNHLYKHEIQPLLK